MSARALGVGITLLLAIGGALLYLDVIMGAPRADREQLALFLALSGGGSLAVGALVVKLARSWIVGLRLRLTFGYLVGLVVALVNVLVTSMLMFLNSHDLLLLLCLLVFAAVVSASFGYSVATALTDELGVLSRAAGQVAGGDLTARVPARGNDELALLGASFNQMATRLQSAFAHERELEADRRAVIASVSHDLRTPLATTRAMVEALTDGVVTEPAEVERYLRLIRSETQHLSRLIDDLFELSQIESGALKLELQPTMLPVLVEQTLDAYEAQARERGVALERREEPAMQPVLADGARLQRALRNLIDNALRYTPAGGSICINMAQQGDHARIAVVDTGAGIAPDDLERVFDRFYRGEHSRPRVTDEAGGTTGAGLGLAIARALVQAHGGRLWAESNPSQGAAFHMELPITTSISAAR